MNNMKNTPVDRSVVDEVIGNYHLPDFGKATIREVVAISSELQERSGTEFIRMEMGVPGLPPSSVGIEAEINALKAGVASIYPDIDGIPELKKQASRFIKAFTDIDISPKGCIPVVGSMQGSYASFLTCCQCEEGKDTILFIDPGFPVQKQQLRVMGYKAESFDVYNYRGAKLHDILESHLQSGRIAGIIYSNPNNPCWICLKEDELEIIGTLAKKYGTVVLEDLAYFAMDFRSDLSTPFTPPFQPSVARYTDEYILMVSASKAFSYAGQRIGVTCISDKLFNKSYPSFAKRYGTDTFGSVFVHRVLYALSSGTSHSAQYALAGMFKAACDGTYDFLQDVKEYERRAVRIKEAFRKNGFHIVYDKDQDVEIADGFYFTVGYPGLTSGELMKELLCYGVSAISLMNTGSRQEGIRACVSFIKDHQYDMLEDRLRMFKEHHSLKTEACKCCN